MQISEQLYWWILYCLTQSKNHAFEDETTGTKILYAIKKSIRIAYMETYLYEYLYDIIRHYIEIFLSSLSK